MRGFYRMRKTHFRDRGEATVTPDSLGAVLLLESGDWVYLYASDMELMPKAAEELARSWYGLRRALTPAQARRVFRKVVRRSVIEDGVKVMRMARVPMSDTKPGDEVRVLRGALEVWTVAFQSGDQMLDEWLVPHQILGD